MRGWLSVVLTMFSVDGKCLQPAQYTTCSIMNSQLGEQMLLSTVIVRNVSTLIRVEGSK